MPTSPTLHIIVKFGAEVTSEEQGRLLFAWEQQAREMTGKRLELFKETMKDDSKLRVMMTPMERAKL